MQVVGLNGTLTEAEQGDHVEIRYDLHHFRDMRKMGGYCIGEPANWNSAKQAELRDTIPNPIH